MATLGVTGKVKYSAADVMLLHNAGRLLKFIAEHGEDAVAKESAKKAADAIPAVSNHLWNCKLKTDKTATAAK